MRINFNFYKRFQIFSFTMIISSIKENHIESKLLETHNQTIVLLQRFSNIN